MSKSFKDGGVLELQGNRYGIALAWDKMKTQVDLDLQAVVVDTKGSIIDAVYYNRLTAQDKALAHSGDDLVGDGEGFDECIWINLTKMKKNVKLIIFCLAAYSGGAVSSAGIVNAYIVEKWQGQAKESFRVAEHSGTAGVIGLCIMNRSNEGVWTVTRLLDEGSEGHHFMDFIEPTLGDIIRRRIKGAPKCMKVSFPMVKGDLADLPVSKHSNMFHVGVGWDMGELGIDLDVSAVLFGLVGQKVGAVYYNNTKLHGVHHTGDNETGEGEGDDETIVVDLNEVPDHVAQVFFVVNVYTKDVTFSSLKNAYVRVIDHQNHEILKYSLNCGNTATGSGLIIARLYRYPKSNRMGFQALGAFCQGRKWMDRVCLKEMQRIFYIKPQDILDHGERTENGTSPHTPRERRNRQLPTVMSGLPAGGFRSGSGTYYFRRDAKQESVSRVRVGCGWDILKCKRGFKTSVDLDVAAVFFHQDGRDLGAIDYENVEEYGIRHSGDNLTGEGEGDDEVIDVDLDAIPEEINQIYFVVTVYTKGMDFLNVENAYCRVCNEDGTELVRHNLTGSAPCTALVIAQLFRHPEQGWCFKARSEFVNARTWIDPTCMLVMKQLFKETLIHYSPDPDAPQPADTPKVTLLWGTWPDQDKLPEGKAELLDTSEPETDSRSLLPINRIVSL
mmetsp:Transcript_67375/g.146654  ORF Transcript_67375/g.146654 Transcript_67375/m.146654 type:complete len:670 (+) Transcript_67375:368-2377(+)